MALPRCGSRQTRCPCMQRRMRSSTSLTAYERASLSRRAFFSKYCPRPRCHREHGLLNTTIPSAETTFSTWSLKTVAQFLLKQTCSGRRPPRRPQRRSSARPVPCARLASPSSHGATFCREATNVQALLGMTRESRCKRAFPARMPCIGPHVEHKNWLRLTYAAC